MRGGYGLCTGTCVCVGVVLLVAFEVVVDGTLVHSKLTKGHGKCNSPFEQRALLSAVETALASKT